MQKTAYQIIEKLQKNGFLAYLAGGSVRDMLMEKTALDFDIATSAKPEEIEKLLKKTIPIGKKFGVILAIENGHHFEIATFRSDAGYTDGRRPDAVYFSSPKKDAERRDFTINGMFFDPITKKVLDFVGGQNDLQNKILRFIGNPYLRIQEDKLRILRAIRFKNRFNFNFELETEKAIQKNAIEIRAVSCERTGEELNKIFSHSSRLNAIQDLDKLGLLQVLIPEITALKDIKQPLEYHLEGDVFTHTLMAFEKLNPQTNLALIWATLLHDTGKRVTFERREDRIHFDGHAEKSVEFAKEITKRFRFNTLLKNKICWLIEKHMQVGQIPEMRLAHKIKLFMHPWFEDLLELHRVDESGSIPVDLSLYEELKKEYQKFNSQKLLTTPLKPILKGDEIIKKFKLLKGPQIGIILKALHEEQLEGKIKNKKEAYEFIRKIIK